MYLLSFIGVYCRLVVVVVTVGAAAEEVQRSVGGSDLTNGKFDRLGLLQDTFDGQQTARFRSGG